MSHNKICLASDNWSGAHPQIIKAITDANNGYYPSYGGDPWTEEATKLIQDALGLSGKVFMVPTGTGTNVLAAKLACRRHESIICSDIAHINYQESGAIESVVGAKLLAIPSKNGKVTPEGILKKLRTERAFGKHSTSPRLLSITQPTEVGTVYTHEELKALSALRQEQNLLLHVDGSRFYNAVASLGIPMNKMFESVKIDLLSLGGTKNGLMGAEALIIFNPQLHEGSDWMHKQTLQLLSKSRYISAQFIPFFKNDLWRTLADHANKQAKKIADCIQTLPQLTLNYPTETNQIFFTAPPAMIPLIQEKIVCFTWDMEKHEIRMITSWCTSDHEVAETQRILREIAV